MILKVIFLVICWVIILFIKKGRFAEFIIGLRSSDKPKWKIWAALFYKSPWFFVTFIGNFLSLLGMIIDKHNSVNLMFNFLPLKSHSVKPKRVFRMDHGLGPWGRMSTDGTKVPPLFSLYPTKPRPFGRGCLLNHNLCNPFGNLGMGNKWTTERQERG